MDVMFSTSLPRVASGIFSGSKVSTLSINNRGHNYYSPVPSPFLSPKQSKAQHSFGAMKMDVASGPTSEPTVLTGHQMHFQADGPTSEPTEYKHHVFTHLQADSVPTSEPTEFRLASHLYFLYYILSDHLFNSRSPSLHVGRRRKLPFE